jgi:RND family efflux transporter MFP subunit
MGIKTQFLPWALAAITAMAAMPAEAASAAEAMPPVPLVTVQRAATNGGFDIDGTIEPVRKATLAAQVGGNVMQLAVKAGAAVKAGQLIARIDERDAAAALARSDAGVAQAQAELANARMNAERTRDLRAKGFISQAALDSAETQFKAAQAGLRQAQAARSQAALARGFSNVLAPFDGIVLATHLDVGDLAAPGRPIVTIYAPGALRAVVQVGMSRAQAARAATRVEVELPDGRRLTPARRTELATADPVSQTIEWRLDLAADAADVMPGQTARVYFQGGAAASAANAAPAALRVPASSVLRRGELTGVYVVQGSGFALRAVRLGADHGSNGIDVVAGLKGGERIAADALRAGLSNASPAK